MARYQHSVTFSFTTTATICLTRTDEEKVERRVGELLLEMPAEEIKVRKQLGEFEIAVDEEFELRQQALAAWMDGTAKFIEVDSTEVE